MPGSRGQLATERGAGHHHGGGRRHEERGDLRGQAIAHREDGVRGGRFARGHVVLHHAHHEAHHHVQAGHQEAGDGVAAHELGGAVHGAEEVALLLHAAAADARLVLGEHAGGEVGVDGHLLARHGVEGKARGHLGHAARALRDNHEVDDDEQHEHRGAHDVVAADHELAEGADDVARGVRTLGAVQEDEPRGGHVERQAEQRDEEEDARECRQIEHALELECHEEERHRHRDARGEQQVEQDGRKRHHHQKHDPHEQQGNERHVA